MNRAAILIGVRQSGGGLPQLQAVDDGIAAMEDWARGQGMLVNVLTDAAGAVTAPQILAAIKAVVDTLSFDQLVIYFSGHGVNIGQCEYWLLSGFPDDPFGVVNVAASVERARLSVIPHVVFISDACRTAAASIRDQIAVSSAPPVFPNPSLGGAFKYVDVFYATTLGRPALEVRDPLDPTGGFRGIYTEVLCDALRGKPPIQPEPQPEPGKGVIRCWPLKQHLERTVPTRVFELNPAQPANQLPDAVISSDPTLWLSSVTLPAVTGPPAQPGPLIPPSHPPEPTPPPTEVVGGPGANLSPFALPESLRPLAADLVMSSDRQAGPSAVPAEMPARVGELVTPTAATFGPGHFESMCGFKVRGASIVEAFSTGAQLEVWGQACRVSLYNGVRNANVVLTFQSGACVVLPALQEFIGGLTFDEGELIDVSYEPSDNSGRWSEFQSRQATLRGLRGIIAASTRMGRFQLEGEHDADEVARQMQLQKGIDPSLGLYAAYAYRRQGNQRRLRQMYEFMSDDLGMVLFDIAMLAGKASPQSGSSPPLLPPTPLLTQGWALLAAFGIELPPALDGLSRHVSHESLWTLYDVEGGRLLRDFLASQ